MSQTVKDLPIAFLALLTLPLWLIWYPISQTQAYRRWRGGHWEYRLYGDVGQYDRWERWPECRAHERRGWQYGTARCEEWPVLHPVWQIAAAGCHYQYGHYLIRHKWFVFIAGCRLGIPWLALLHDNSKFSSAEFGPYARFFYETDGSKKQRQSKTGYYKPTDTGDLAFDAAWLHHVRANKHHWQSWACPDTEAPGGVKVFEMPDRYRREMLADWIGAGLAQGAPDTLGWYTANRDKLMLGPRTRFWIEDQLGFDFGLVGGETPVVPMRQRG